MRLLQQIKELLIPVEVGTSKKEGLPEHQILCNHPAADFFSVVRVGRKIVVFKVHIAKAQTLVAAQFRDHALHAAPPVRPEHPGGGAEGTAIGAAPAGHHVSRVAAGLQNGVIRNGNAIQVFHTGRTDDGVPDAALHHVQDDPLPFSDDDLIGVLRRLLRQGAGVDAAQDHPRSGLPTEAVGQLVGPRRGGCHGVQTEYVHAFGQPLVIQGGIELLIDLHLMPRRLQNVAQDQRTRDGVCVPVKRAAQPVEALAPQPAGGRDEYNFHKGPLFLGSRAAALPPARAWYRSVRRSYSSLFCPHLR